jgi:type II secretory pathway component GspD/PulD (secretin)
MKTTRCVLAVIMVIFLICTDLVMNTSVHAKTADDLLTFHFENTTLADALQQITKVTGIKIHINKNFNKAIVGKSFLEASLEYILRDLFRPESVTIEWLYGQKGLETVFITIYENQKDQSPASRSSRPFDGGSNTAEDAKAAVTTPAPPIIIGPLPPSPMSPGLILDPPAPPVHNGPVTLPQMPP